MAVKWYNPNMTAPNAPLPYIASSDRAVYGIYAPWRAFQENVPTVYTQGDSWTPGLGITSGYLQIDMGTPTIVSDYRLRVRGDYSQPGYEAFTGMARNWTLRGSNDGVNFDIIDTRTNITNWSASNIWNTFSLTGPVKYRYYRLVVTASNGANWLIIGKLQFGAKAGKVLFQNTTNLKYFTVSGPTAVEVADGSKSTADASGVEMGTTFSTTTVSNFKTLVGVPFRVINYTTADAAPKVTIRENFTGWLTAKSIPVSLVGVEDLVSITPVTAGNIRHAFSFDDALTWVRHSGTEWVQINNISEGMTTAEVAALTKEQLNMARAGTRANATSITFGHALSAGASITSLTLKVNMEGEIRIAPSSSYTQAFNQGERTITFNISKTGQYYINYADSI